RSVTIMAVLAATAAGACMNPGATRGVPDNARSGSGIIIDGEQLRARGGGLLDGLVGRVGNMRVERGGASRCPVITLRGPRTLMGPSNPKVYIDGTPIYETCTLDQIRVRDVAKVELYPGGSTHRPGYMTSPYGLILVFLTGS
ncbi:MAG: TonB-dependent receptor plug domain-containing protein, partial [Gemmatimonadota bacterium]|nr:TonB-dependent receptor plug domain-containing protein [Gemmatimonadota bacterium]